MDAGDFNTTETLTDGEVVRIRALRPRDKGGLAGLLTRLSAESIYQRFLGPRTAFKERDLAYLTNLDFRRRVALVATLTRDDQEVIVGVARYMVAPGDSAGRPELGIVVEDAEQHRGIGTLLLQHLLKIAIAQGVAEIEAHILAENEQMIVFLSHLGKEVTKVTSEGVTTVTFRPANSLRRVPDC